MWIKMVFLVILRVVYDLIRLGFLVMGCLFTNLIRLGFPRSQDHSPANPLVVDLAWTFGRILVKGLLGSSKGALRELQRRVPHTLGVSTDGCTFAPILRLSCLQNRNTMNQSPPWTLLHLRH